MSQENHTQVNGVPEEEYVSIRINQVRSLNPTIIGFGGGSEYCNPCGEE